MKNNGILLLILLIYALLLGCDNTRSEVEAVSVTADTQVENKNAFLARLNQHLKAVENRDLATLRSTLSPEENMQLILPASEIIDKVEGFMGYHEAWFEEPTWTMDNTVLNTEVGENMGMAIVEAMYREPDRDGKPYFNRLIVSYTLKKYNGQWYIIKDHATSAEKSTDAAGE